jgi:hypothetical protein
MAVAEAAPPVRGRRFGARLVIRKVSGRLDRLEPIRGKKTDAVGRRRRELEKARSRNSGREK